MDDYFPGLALRSAEGDDRVTLLVHDTGSILSFTLAGNDALLLGVEDSDAEGAGGSPYLELLQR